MPSDPEAPSKTSSSMEHLDSLIASLAPEEIAYLRSALEAVEAPDMDEAEGEEIPLTPEDEE